MTAYQLARPGQIYLSFEGELLAEVDSKDSDDQRRWTEIRIYRTDTDRWVTEIIGRSLVRGEKDRTKVAVCDTPAEVRVSLRREDQISYLTNLALEALEVAAEADARLLDAVTEHI
jgi:hypothetical protein